VYCILGESTSVNLLTSLSIQLVLVWSPGKGSPIHDHGNAHCLMKILKGNLTETRYAFPQQGHNNSLEIISETTHSENEVVYMADELGLHRMSNDGGDFAVSLHCKPNDSSSIASIVLINLLQYIPLHTWPGKVAIFLRKRRAEKVMFQGILTIRFTVDF
jgi:hypothetical protein